MSDKDLLSDNDETVAAYLLEHPDFLSRHPDVLAALEGGQREDGAISLVEKQVAVLRKQNSEAEAGRVELIETARTNANLSVCLHKVALELLRDVGLDRTRLSRAGKASGVSRVCRTVLNQRIPDVTLFTHWFGGFLADDSDTDDVTVLDEKDQRIASLAASLFMAGEPGCGPFSEPERIVLFGHFAASMQSAVAAPLVEPGTKSRMGILVLASDDPARFAPGKGTMFLVQLVQLIESVFARAAKA